MTAEDRLILAANSVPARVPIAETFLRQRKVNVYRCPVCRNVFRHDDEYEPMCTGPGALDTHPMTVMKLDAISERLDLSYAR